MRNDSDFPSVLSISLNWYMGKLADVVVMANVHAKCAVSCHPTVDGPLRRSTAHKYAI